MSNNFLIMKTKKFFYIKISFILFIIVASLQSCKNDDSDDVESAPKYVMPDSLFKTITIDTVSQCPLVNSITLTGQVTFNEDKVAKLYPLVSGVITGTNVMLGDYVTKGEPLATIHSAEMAGYSNDLVTAQTSLTVAKKNLDATQEMASTGLASQRDLLNAQAGYDQAKSELNKANSVLDINGGSVKDDYVIKSPISGFVVEKNITNAMSIRTDNSNNLFTISDLSNVWILANVYESNIANVHLGDSVDVTTLSYPDKIFRGKIDKVFNVLDPTNKVMKVRVVLANSGYLLKPQMFANVTLDTRLNQQAICVPEQTLIFNDNQYYVLLYKNRSDIEIKPVRIISIVGGKAFISAGINSGDAIIGSQALLIYQALNV